MKESGMDKLIELLNEYEAKDYEIKPGAVFWHLSGANEPLYAGWTAYASSFLIPSKEYGFIKWLIDNDKIDRDRILKENGLFKMYFYDLEYVKNYDKLIMWLSVEDNPIEFLISILK